MLASSDANRLQCSVWQDSADICVLSDSERHPAHVTRVCNRWMAFDATQPNASATGFKFLGEHTLVEDAKGAAERAIRGEYVRTWIEVRRARERSPGGCVKRRSADSPASEALRPSVHSLLEATAFSIEWATLRCEWRLAQRLVRKLVTIDFPELSVSQSDEWLEFAEAAVELGRAVLRRRTAEIQTALADYRRQLAKLR